MIRAQRQVVRRSGAVRHFPDMRTARIAALLAATAVLLSACATTGGSSPGTPSAGMPLGAVAPAPPEGDVIGLGTVMDVAGEVELCLGPIAESYPPQCSGIPVAGWSWDGVEGSDASGDVRWGAYAVQGVYDGTSFTVTQQPILLALYDPMVPDDPFGGGPGTADEATLLAIQEELPERLGTDYFSSWPQDGRLRVEVLWDDGTWQRAADAEFGTGVVVIEPALRPAG